MGGGGYEVAEFGEAGADVGGVVGVEDVEGGLHARAVAGPLLLFRVFGLDVEVECVVCYVWLCIATIV